MVAEREHLFAELIVDRKLLESFSGERSAYHSGESEDQLGNRLMAVRRKLRWHISNTLSPRQREVISLYLKGKKEREIARLLGVTQQVVNIYKWRAIKKLRQTIAV